MSTRIPQIRTALAGGPLLGGALCGSLGITRPTLARDLASMAGEIVTWGAARATRYALRDNFRGLSDIPVYRVSDTGQITRLGLLIPVRPDGFVVVQADGATSHHASLPWWISDMRPQGFLGRAYAHQHATRLGLPADVRHWSDADAIRALVLSGGDTVGNVLLGDFARDRFVNANAPALSEVADYPQLAAQALTLGETWSSAGGEQPKFCTFTARGHVLVKFTAADPNRVTARWRDLLLAEHLALKTLAAAGVPAAVSRVVDRGEQRFLELLRFDRVGPYGRRALLSLACLDGEFVGNAAAPWPVLTSELAKQKAITPQAHADASLLYAFGILVGNTDMHAGNLSFVSAGAPPYALGPAYDMLSMAFSPTAGGVVRDTLLPPHLHPLVEGVTWRSALVLALDYITRLRSDTRFSTTFEPCIDALSQHVADAQNRIGRLG